MAVEAMCDDGVKYADVLLMKWHEIRWILNERKMGMMVSRGRDIQREKRRGAGDFGSYSRKMEGANLGRPHLLADRDSKPGSPRGMRD